MGHGTAISLTEWSHPATNKTITVNTINNYNKGILVASTNNARVSGNTISNLKLMPIPLSNLRAMGIRIEGGSNNIVQGNTVQNNNASSIDWRWEGISVSEGINITVSCNDLKKLGKSILFSGNCYPAYVKKNTMQNGIAGFVLSNGGYIGQQGVQGTPWDNEWKSNFSYHLYTADASTNGALSNWYTGTTNSFINPNPFISGGINPIIHYTTNGSLFQLCAIPLSPVSIAYSSTMDDIANNIIPELQYPDYQKWMSHHGLMKILKTDSSLMQYPVLSSFEQQQMALSNGKILQIEDTLLVNDISAAAQLLSQLQTETLPDSIRKEVLNIGVSAVFSGFDDWATAISASQWDKLKEIAWLCPFIYGEDVYLSRVMLKLVGDTTLYFNDCEEISEPFSDKSLQMQSENENNINVYPNPASDIVTVETDYTLPATIDFYSQVGQLLKTVEIVNPSTEIDVSGIGVGLILYEIKNAEGKIQIGYLNIVR
jgi:parallel beta-helix repeat protein